MKNLMKNDFFFENKKYIIFISDKFDDFIEIFIEN